jgi:hypothetical protein
MFTQKIGTLLMSTASALYLGELVLRAVTSRKRKPKCETCGSSVITGQA